MKLRVGTRRSPLALTQTGQAMEQLKARVAGLSYELVEIVTTGDRILDRPLREAGGKGLFLKELDEALLDGRIDCAVHSMKDVPTDLAVGTVVAAVLERADARDVLITNNRVDLEGLPAGAVVGTTSLRRQAQILAVIPGAQIRLLRGNVQTRLGRLAEGHCDATFLAMAGLERLGIAPIPGVALDPTMFVPAPGQGALAITAREQDAEVLAVLGTMDHGDSRVAVSAERAFARVFGGGCHLPLAAHAHRSGNELVLVGVLIAPDGSRAIRELARMPLASGLVAATGGAADLARLGGSSGRGQGSPNGGSEALLADAVAQAEELGTAMARSFFDRDAQAILDLAAGAGS